jgi:hypothetical protein
MDPTTTAVSIAVLASLATGFVAGRTSAPNGAVKAIEAQTAALATLNEGNEALVERVNAVALLEAESDAQIADKLTGIPPQCIPELGGDPMSPQCAWAWCVRTGETDAQRCEAGKFTDYLIARYQASDVACPD